MNMKSPAVAPTAAMWLLGFLGLVLVVSDPRATAWIFQASLSLNGDVWWMYQPEAAAVVTSLLVLVRHLRGAQTEWSVVDRMIVSITFVGIVIVLNPFASTAEGLMGVSARLDLWSYVIAMVLTPATFLLYMQRTVGMIGSMNG